MGGIFQWPGAVHEGRGKCQPFVDERADAAQRDALIKIMSGQDTAPMATMFAVYFLIRLIPVQTARRAARPA